MKVKRYPAGRTNVGELQSQRAALRSPQEVAMEAEAPYKAISGATANIADDIAAEDERRKRLQAQEDAITEKMAYEELKVAVNELENDPRYDNQLQEDGQPTASVMLNTYEERAKGVRELLSDIQDPKTRANAQRLFDMTTQTTRLGVQKLVNDRREQWNTQGLFDLRDIQYAAQDWTAYNQTNRELREQGHITQDQYSTAENAGENAQRENAAQEIADRWYEEYKRGNGDAAYEQVVKSDLPPELKSLAESKIETQQANLKKVDKKKAAVAKVEVLKNQTLMKLAIKMGAPLPMSVGEFVSSGMGYTPEMDAQMITWGQELLLSQVQAIGKDTKYQAFAANRTNKIPMVNTKSNTEMLDQEIAEGFTPDMTDQEKIEHAEVTMRDAGMVSFNYDQMFMTAPYNSVRLGEVAQTWGRLMLGTDINNALQTNVGEKEQTVLTDTWNNIQAGISPTEAGEMAREMSSLWDRDRIEMEARQDYYGGRDTQGKTRGQKEARAAFKELIDDSFDTIPWLASPIQISAIDDPGQADFLTEGGLRDAYAFYEEYFYQSYMRTNDMAKAAIDASQKFSQNFNMNNINGDMQIERGGVKGDWNWKREAWIDENRNDVFIYGSDGAKIGGLDDVGDVTYRNPVIMNGDFIYQVWGEEGPLMKDVEVKGKLNRQIVIDRITTKDANEKEIEALQKETESTLKGYQKEYETAIRMQQSGNIYSRGKNLATLREYEAKIAAEERRLEEEIEKIRSR